jgi:hypothetical protein
MKAIRVMAFVALIGFALGIAIVGDALAGERYKIAGTVTAATTKSEVFNVGDTEGHIVLLGESEGVNVSTGERNFLDGAQNVGLDFVDLVMGNGPGQSYCKVSKGKDAAFYKTDGKATTTLSAEGIPVTTFAGTYSYYKGAGQFEGIQGGGTYKGKYISRTIWVADWEGEYWIQK